MQLADFNGSIGFVGAGNMASALVHGLLGQGFPAQRVAVTDIDTGKLQTLVRELGVRPLADAGEVVAQSSVVVLAVKPASVAPLLETVAGAAREQLFLSVAAGITCQVMENALGSGARVVRAMPNTPALVGEGVTGLCAGTAATRDDLELATALLGTVGRAETVPEAYMDVLTGLSGSGPAFVLLMLEALADGAVHQGLPRPVALRFAAQTMRGTAALLQATGKHPGELKDMVTSPAGTTIAGVEALERNGFRGAVMQAVIAATQRAKALSG